MASTYLTRDHIVKPDPLANEDVTASAARTAPLLSS